MKKCEVEELNDRSLEEKCTEVNSQKGSCIATSGVRRIHFQFQNHYLDRRIESWAGNPMLADMEQRSGDAGTRNGLQ